MSTFLVLILLTRMEPSVQTESKHALVWWRWSAVHPLNTSIQGDSFLLLHRFFRVADNSIVDVNYPQRECHHKVVKGLNRKIVFCFVTDTEIQLLTNLLICTNIFVRNLTILEKIQLRDWGFENQYPAWKPRNMWHRTCKLSQKQSSIWRHYNPFVFDWMIDWLITCAMLSR